MGMFSGKHVLVTGAGGFIGSHLTEFLVEEGADVRALVHYNSNNNWGWLERSPYAKDIEVVCGDVRDYDCCQMISKGIDIIFNLAALIAIPYSYVAPQSYIDTNVHGSLNICRAALHQDVKRVIQTSTSEVYGTARYVPIDEKHPLQPQSPYSASKIGADMIAMSFYNSFNLDVTIARPFNTYGPRQSARAFIPTVISQIGKGMTQIKVGDLRPTRDFNYVRDTCRGFAYLANSDQVSGKTINIGSNYEISMKDTLHKISQIMGREVEFIVDQERLRPENSEVFRLWCDNTKIKELTGFKPEYTIDEGLQKTVEWFMDGNHLIQYKENIYNV